MSRSWQNGSTAGWRKLRARILQRDAYLCQLKLPDVCTTVARCVHHTKGRSITGDDPRHLVAACIACNLAVGDPTRRQHDPDPRPISKW